MMRNRGVNDPTWRAGRRPAPRSGVVHATVPGVRRAVTDAARKLAQFRGTDLGSTCARALQKRKMDLETFW